MFHRSERLLLRPAWAEDWRAVYDGVAHEETVRNLVRAPWPYREQDARDFVALPVAALFPRFMITLAASGAVIGSLGIDANDGVPELGYWIARPHWGQGYATEAGSAALRIARMLGHDQVLAAHFVDNPASGRVLRKLGFVPTGVVVERSSLGRAEPAPVVEYGRHLDTGAALDRAA